MGLSLKWAPWSDHLPLWVALGATVATGIYENGEIALMVLPLVAAAAVQALRWDLDRRRRWVELGALAFFLGDLARGHGIFPVAIQTLFVLAGARLALPRELAHRRQLLLIGFLLFLTTAIAGTDLLFLVWMLAWACAAALALLQQAWEPSAALRPGPPPLPPLARVPLWVGAAALFGAGFFVILPRLSLGLRPALLTGAATAMSQAGLSERLDLSGGGPLEPNPEVALRIAPTEGVDPRRDPGWTQGLALLRGITLEVVRGSRWEPAPLTPALVFARTTGAALQRAEVLYTPTSHGILALPAGLISLEPVELPLVPGPGASLRWRYPRARTAPITVSWDPQQTAPAEPRLPPRRLEVLTHLEPEHEAARRASLRFAPGILPAPQLAEELASALQRFRYTLENPAGTAANPLEDFLERSQAGHCEYFASALALMLRARGVPARVVSGYRLGPWIPEGGYFRVSQNEAHSWVEYWHEGRWFTVDPTPAGAAASAGGAKGFGPLERWVDALRYRWERYVVRFSDQDQQTGLAWLQARAQSWEWRWQAPSRPLLGALGLTVFAWTLWRTRARWRPVPEGPGRIRALAPLLARTRRIAAPQVGETARAWLLRLGDLRPDRQEALATLADAVDAEAYAGSTGAATAQAKAEARAWRGWKPTSG